MAIYEVVLTGTYKQQEWVNRFNYVSTGTPGAQLGSLSLITALGGIYDGLLPAPGYPADGLFYQIARLMVGGSAIGGVTAFNVYDPVDFYSTPFVNPLPGTFAGEGMSPAVAIGFRSNRSRRDVRRGQKRFTAVSEGAFGEGGIATPTLLSVAAGVIDAMNEVRVYNDEGNNLTFSPAVCGKEKYLANVEKGTFAYRYYATEAAQLDHTMTGIEWELLRTMRTQNSRQYGRGR